MQRAYQSLNSHINILADIFSLCFRSGLIKSKGHLHPAYGYVCWTKSCAEGMFLTCVNEVASLIENGTSKTLARVRARSVFPWKKLMSSLTLQSSLLPAPDPVGPLPNGVSECSPVHLIIRTELAHCFSQIMVLSLDYARTWKKNSFVKGVSEQVPLQGILREYIISGGMILLRIIYDEP